MRSHSPPLSNFPNSKKCRLWNALPSIFSAAKLQLSLQLLSASRWRATVASFVWTHILWKMWRYARNEFHAKPSAVEKTSNSSGCLPNYLRLDFCIWLSSNTLHIPNPEHNFPKFLSVANVMVTTSTRHPVFHRSGASESSECAREKVGLWTSYSWTSCKSPSSPIRSHSH